MPDCRHPARSLVDPRPSSHTGGPERVWVARCRACGSLVVLDEPQNPRKDVGNTLHAPNDAPGAA